MTGNDRCLQARDLLIQRMQLRQQSAECLACQWRQRCGVIFNEQRSKLADTADALGRNDAEFGKVPADSIHQHRSLPDQ